MKSTFKQTGRIYQYESDCLISELELDDADHVNIGTYGRMRQRFLMEQHSILYNSMLLSGKLWRHLKETDIACRERLEYLIPAMARKEGVTEKLKASDQMAWVGRMNSIRNRAEEIILDELVYAE